MDPPFAPYFAASIAPRARYLATSPYVRNSALNSTTRSRTCATRAISVPTQGNITVILFRIERYHAATKRFFAPRPPRRAASAHRSRAQWPAAP